LGTSNTLIYVKGQGIVLSEPSMVAVNQKTGRVVAVGTDAKLMVGRTPAHIEAISPLTGSVISNFEVAEEMLSYFIKRAGDAAKKRLLRPRVVVSVPTGITNVERRAVRDAIKNAGAREVHMSKCRWRPRWEFVCRTRSGRSMIIDIGGGTTDIAVVSLGGIVKSKILPIAGDKLNADIMSYVRDEFKILLGEKTAEDVKIQIGSVQKDGPPKEATIRGRDLVTGLPREVIITDADIREAITHSISILIDSIKEVLESTPPEVVSDVMRRGIVLVGGGSLISGLPELLERELEMPIHLEEEPKTAVIRGAGVILEDLIRYSEILIDNEDELPPR